MNRYLIIVIMFICCNIAQASDKAEISLSQEYDAPPKVMEVFSKYGKKQNVKMVELSSEMLDTFGMTFYKSIMIRRDEKALEFVRNCLRTDQVGAKKIKEITDSGGIISAYYQLRKHSSNYNRFILFKVSKNNDITLVYIEGDLDSDDLITLLFSSRELQ